MATAGEIASQALKRILVEADEAPLEASEYADFLDAMNNYMAALEGDGYLFGYEPVGNVNDEVTVPDSILRALVANLAIDVHADYGGQITDSLAKQAVEGYRTLLRVGKPRKDAAVNARLPDGSGNWNTYHYPSFGGEQFDVVHTIYSTKPTTFTATDTYTRVKGWWKSRRSLGLLSYVTGRVELDEPHERTSTFKFNGRASGNSTYTFALMKNGEEVIATVTKALTGVPDDLLLSTSVEIRAGDYLELHVKDDLATQSMTLTNGRVVIS